GRGTRGWSWTPPSPATCARRPTTPVAAPGRTASGSVVLPDAADHDPVLLDLDLHLAMPGPVLRVDRVVLNGGIEPQAVALLAVVEGALERASGLRAAAGLALCAAARQAPSPPPAAPAPCGRGGRLLVLRPLLGL